MLLYLTDDERHTVDEIARVLQIAVDDVAAALRVLERLDLVGLPHAPGRRQGS
jgi:DNA-binding transcriptional regulator GbsR (MarR family)